MGRKIHGMIYVLLAAALGVTIWCLIGEYKSTPVANPMLSPTPTQTTYAEQVDPTPLSQERVMESSLPSLPSPTPSVNVADSDQQIGPAVVRRTDDLDLNFMREFFANSKNKTPSAKELLLEGDEFILMDAVEISERFRWIYRALFLPIGTGEEFEFAGFMMEWAARLADKTYVFRQIESAYWPQFNKVCYNVAATELLPELGNLKRHGFESSEGMFLIAACFPMPEFIELKGCRFFIARSFASSNHGVYQISAADLYCVHKSEPAPLIGKLVIGVRKAE